MEAAVDKLEAMFQKAESDINYVSRKLDQEFASNSDDNQLNPNKMLQKIGEIKKEYGELLKEAQQIQQAQQEATEFFKTQLVTVCQAVQSLEQQTDIEPEQKIEEFHKLEEMLGIKLPDNDTETKTSQSFKNETVTLSQPVIVNNDEEISMQESEESSNASPNTWAPVLSPAERRKDSDEFIEVTEAEFQSVSSLVRGRVKLVDVNSTYRAIWTHFQDDDNTEELTPANMYKKGLKVTGQTGVAKLNVLRALKLLQISKQGGVKLL